MAGDSKVDFATQIKPLLSDRCFLCHGPDAETREADLRLDTKEGAFAVLASDDTLHAITAGKPEASEMLQRINSADSDLLMPPADSGLSLNSEEKALLKQWISEGAEWKGHWSFEPIRKPEIPTVKNADWCRTPIDYFILSQLERRGIPHSTEAVKTRLIRRATFDLTGLPPTLQEIDDFVADQSPSAWEKVVDRLLASPRFGERMTSEWLDVARYSDTYGYQQDRDRYVWPWRDWVIRAFNGNLPYDQFIIEQLAGDLIPGATKDQILATTFNRLHPQKVEGGSVPEEFRVEYVADRAQTMSTAFLGLTLECARCHDHKYDPISQREYYQFFSFFNNIDEAGLYSYFTSSVPTPTLRLPNDQQAAALKSAHAEQVRAERSLADFLASAPADADVRKVKLSGPVASLTFEDGNMHGNRAVDGRSGKAVELTGDNGINVGAGNFRRSQPFSVSTWLKTPKTFERCVVFHRSRAWTDAASRGYELLIEDGRLSAALIHFWPGNAIRIQAVDPLPLNEWIHVGVTWDGSSTAAGLQLWCNGQPCQTRVVRDNLYKNITGGGGDNIAIGQRFRDVGFAGGQVDDFEVYDRELSALEIFQLHRGRAVDQLAADIATAPGDFDAADLAAFCRRYGSPESGKLIEAVRVARQKYNDLQNALQEIMIMRERSEPRQAFVLSRGAYDAPADEVASETPTWLPPMSEGMPANRMGLARWLVSDEHPLTARVAVNRYWQLLMGSGLVRTPEDFGSQGMVPTHPDLLDWLASDFRTHNWNLKRLLKQIMMSATYRQSSRCSEELLAADPDNMLWARAPVYRLTAESLRDNALFVCGLMTDSIGGAPARPYELAASFKPAKPDTGPGLYRRSLYTYWKRTAPAPVMMALDASKREVCRVQRERTASPLQALVVLNGPQFVEAGRSLAARLMTKHGDDDAAILVDMFRLLTSRYPTEADKEILTDLLLSQREHFQTDPAAAAKYLTVGQLKIDDSPDQSRLAAWASIANTLFAFDECMMKR
ncbi:MAG: DUF1553 domain-containing protein [Planctomycetaceae bacterium]|nr:DUF1553 domain-containing protein [Planctomycetaceae bacterium]